MNTINNINTNTMNATSSNTENQQSMTTKKSNWMIEAAGLLFWVTVVFQFGFITNDNIDWEFANHIIYNILPLTGALAYFGLKKELTAISERKAECQQNTDSDC